MTDKKSSLTLPALHKTLQKQVDQAAERADARKSEKMMENCYMQSSAIGKMDKDIADVKTEVSSAIKALIKKADNDANLEILTAYGEISQ